MGGEGQVTAGLSRNSLNRRGGGRGRDQRERGHHRLDEGRWASPRASGGCRRKGKDGRGMHGEGERGKRD